MPWVECPECGKTYRRLPEKSPCPECGTPLVIEDHRLQRSVNHFRWHAIISGIILAVGLVVLTAWESDVLPISHMVVPIAGGSMVALGLLGILWSRYRMWMDR